MKLYDLKRGDWFRIVGDNRFPPSHPNVDSLAPIRLGHIDGMYSLCYLKDGTMVHPAAWAEVAKLTHEEAQA